MLKCFSLISNEDLTSGEQSIKVLTLQLRQSGLDTLSDVMMALWLWGEGGAIAKE